VLVIDGEEREGTFQSGSDFLRLALMPYKEGDKRNPVEKPIVMRPDAWGESDLQDVRLLVLSNVPVLSEAQADLIRRFTYGGGGLIVWPGDQTRVDNYNAQLPWLPAALGPATADSQSGATTLGAVEMAHPVFGFLKGRADPAPPVVRRSFPATPRAGARVLVSYSDGHQ